MKITAIIPWLVKDDSSYWGEYLFVEVRTDEGVTGWGEITSTTKVANRAVAAILRQLNDLLVGEDPTAIERLWHKTFRSFTYMGSRGATSHVVSGIDIALWDIVGKIRDLPIHEMLGGKVRDDVLIYTHPDQRKFTSRDGVVEEISAILDAGHTAIKFDPFPYYEGNAGSRHGYLDGELPKKGEREAVELTALIRETTGPDVDILIDAHGRFNVPTAIRLCRALEDAGQIDWFEEPVPPESYHALKQVREPVERLDLGRRAAAHALGVRADPGERAGRLRDAGRHLDRRHHRAEEDRDAGRGVLHPDLAARRQRPDQRHRRRAGRC